MNTRIKHKIMIIMIAWNLNVTHKYSNHMLKVSDKKRKQIHLLHILYTSEQEPGGGLNIKMLSYQYWYYHYKDKMVWQPSYLYNGNPHPWNDCLYIETGSCFSCMCIHWQVIHGNRNDIVTIVFIAKATTITFQFVPQHYLGYTVNCYSSPQNNLSRSSQLPATAVITLCLMPHNSPRNHCGSTCNKLQDNLSSRGLFISHVLINTTKWNATSTTITPYTWQHWQNIECWHYSLKIIVAKCTV